jgi:cytochrome c oxidase cbb3-type subunit 3
MADKNNPYNVPDTGHVWDDNLRELLNQPPKWWMWGLYASIAVVIAYGIFYPMWPLVNTHTKGFLGWTSIGEYKQDLNAIEEVRGVYEKRLQGDDMTPAAILADDELKQYTVRSAKVLFGDNCAACHGSGGQGNPGYPVLADDDWLYGGSVAKIQETIINGRQGVMPAHVNTLSDAEITTLAEAIKAGNPTSVPLYMEKGCFACHGPDGKGNHMLGSANLTDSIWRFGDGSLESIKYTIANGVNDASNARTRNAVMPTFGGGKLSDTDIKKLAVYVHQLGGGQ